MLPSFIARRRRSDFLQPRGVSVHIGSQITDVEPFGEAMERVVALVQSLRADGFDIRYVDAGGGLGISYEDPASVGLPPRGPAICQSADAAAQGHRGFICCWSRGAPSSPPPGVLLTRVIYRKRNDGKQFVIVDAAMNDLIRPALYEAYHEIVPVVPRPYTGDDVEPLDIVGPVCESGDFFARDREIAGLAEGDLLADPRCRRVRHVAGVELQHAGHVRPRCWWTASEPS